MWSKILLDWMRMPDCSVYPDALCLQWQQYLKKKIHKIHISNCTHTHTHTLSYCAEEILTKTNILWSACKHKRLGMSIDSALLYLSLQALSVIIGEQIGEKMCWCVAKPLWGHEQHLCISSSHLKLSTISMATWGFCVTFPIFKRQAKIL